MTIPYIQAVHQDFDVVSNVSLVIQDVSTHRRIATEITLEQFFHRGRFQHVCRALDVAEQVGGEVQ